MKKLLLSFFLLTTSFLNCQTNLLVTNTIADQVIKGNFDPLQFASSNPVSDHQQIVQYIQNNVQPDSLKAYILKLATFENRNTGSDTLSSTTGIGAARRWAFSKFQEFSSLAENRLIPSYFQFDQSICSMNQHRNILAVLPGTNTDLHEVIIIEGHIDSRCETSCDILCQAQGIEDNASGSALVLELARVMSNFSYPNTIVFMLTIG